MVARMPTTGGRFGRIAAIAWHESRAAWRDSTVVALAVVLSLLIGAAAIVSDARHRVESEQRERYQTVVGEQFGSQPDRHPHRVSHYGYLLFRPRAPLGMFDVGVESFAGTSIFLEAHRQNSANFSAAGQGGGNDRFGELSMATVLQYLLPLFIFAVGGVAVTRERESGTLPLLLCQGASWSAVLWGKWCGMLLLVGLAVTPGLLIAVGWLAWSQGIAGQGDVAARVAGLVGLHVAYLAGCAALAVAVSAGQRTSRGALVWLTAIWFGLWVVLPRTLPMIGTALYPVPARTAFDNEVETRVLELGDTHNPDDPIFARLRADTLRQYGVSRVEDLPLNYNGLVTAKGEEATTAAFREHLARLNEVYRSQNRLVEWAGVVSPYVSTRLVSMALAGSDGAHQIEFERQAEEYRYRLVQALNELHTNQVAHVQDRYGGIVNGAPTRARIEAAYFDALPRFDYATPVAGWALAQAWGGVMACGVSLVAMFLVLARMTRRRPQW